MSSVRVAWFHDSQSLSRMPIPLGGLFVKSLQMLPGLAAMTGLPNVTPWAVGVAISMPTVT